MSLSTIDVSEILAFTSTMKFDKYLITPCILNNQKVANMRCIKVPICFAMTILVLREKHEFELERDTSFIENDYSKPSNELIELKVNEILFNCPTQELIRECLSDLDAVSVFYILLKLLDILPEKLFKLSENSIRALSELKLNIPKSWFDFEISQHMLDGIKDYYDEADQNEQKIFMETRLNKQIVKNGSLSTLIQNYYHCNKVDRKECNKLINKFNKCIYHDLHTRTNLKYKNLIRFIVRNLIHLLRRYQLNCLKRLKAERQMNWPAIMIRMGPKIIEYSTNWIASLVAPVLIGIPDGIDSDDFDNDLLKVVLYNMLASSIDNMWCTGLSHNQIFVHRRNYHCHSNCVCGEGK